MNNKVPTSNLQFVFHNNNTTFRSDRSMSLPLSSYNTMDLSDIFSLPNEGPAGVFDFGGPNKLLSSHNLLSPLRKMDFALCKRTCVLHFRSR